MRYRWRTITLLLAALSSCSIAVSGNNTEDSKGSADHPLISRYQHSHIIQYSQIDYDTYDLATGPIPANAERNARPPIQPLAGKITTLIYQANSAEHSVLQIYRNFEQAFQQAGVKALFSCANQDCGKEFPRQLFAKSAGHERYRRLDPSNIKRSSQYYFFTGQLQHQDHTAYITLMVSKRPSKRALPLITLDVVEIKAMATDLVTLTPDALSQSLSAQGRVVLDGILFDHNKATLQAASDNALQAIADYLTQHPQQNVFIVGHTDNVGRYQYNLTLSQQRAAAVAAALTQRFAIAAKRLQAVGVGEVSPLFSNQNAAGQAKNRRVEMVLMEPD